MLFLPKYGKYTFGKAYYLVPGAPYTHVLCCRTPPFCENAPPVGPVKEVTSPHGGLAFLENRVSIVGMELT